MAEAVEAHETTVGFIEHELEVPEDLQACEVCREIWKYLSNPEATGKIDLGSFENAMSTTCAGHKPLVEAFNVHIQKYKDVHRREISEDLGLIAHGKGYCLTLNESLKNLGAFMGLLLAKEDGVSSHPGTGRVLDPDWMDLEMLKSWKDECLLKHGTNCENPMKIWGTQPAWLIDVEKRCVVPGQGNDKFVALSYQWGRHSTFRMTHDIMAKFQKPESLDSTEAISQLAPIVRHAMHLTRVIGERYLWVDALCINHSDREATAEQLDLMGAIYANAIVTIIGGDGDGQSGLAGLRGVSDPRKMNQIIIPFGKNNIVVRNTGIFEMNSGSPYYDRGWTYQEYEMSKRRILFRNEEIHWECSCSVWHEELVFRAQTDVYINPRWGDIAAGFPDIEAIDHCIQRYNDRNLTFDEDALAGISGLLAIASRSFPDGFLYGLAEMQFERGLCWKPCWDHIDLQRRQQSDRPDESRISSYALPSWSWIGWQGLIRFAYEALRINDRCSWISETIPITEWYTSDSLHLEGRRRIKSTWLENRNKYKKASKNIETPLPKGWTRHERPSNPSTVKDNEPQLWPDGCEKYVFEHKNLPYSDDGDTNTWYYPFPVADVDTSTPLYTPPQTKYLFCKTKRAFLYAHQKFDGSDNNLLILRDAGGRDIGTVHAHNEAQKQLCPTQGAVDDGVLGKKLELVAICITRRYEKIFDKEKSRFDGIAAANDLYQLLWIEWKDSYAERKACGTVERSEWEALDLEDVDLVLG